MELSAHTFKFCAFASLLHGQYGSEHSGPPTSRALDISGLLSTVVMMPFECHKHVFYQIASVGRWCGSLS